MILKYADDILKLEQTIKKSKRFFDRVFSLQKKETKLMDTNYVIDKIKSVNGRWLKTNPQNEDTSWDNACYFRGDIEAYKITGEKEYLDAAVEWGEKNKWGTFGDEKFAAEVLENHFTVEGKLDWCYENVADYLNIHADFVFCGMTYLELEKFVPDKARFDKVMSILDFTVNDPHNDYWWWVDTIHMGLCLYHKVSLMKNDDRYAKKAHALYLYAKETRGYYDTEEHLWYRDMKYTPDKMLSKNGKKVFWSRGNGWVYAGLIQTMEVIGKESEYYDGYKKTFLEMTDAIMKCRGKDGFWRTNLADYDEYPMIETSGTLLFIHSILKAVRYGVLDESYIKIFEESFKAINEKAIFEDGTLGYVQGVAQSPGEVCKNGTREYAVGYYLMTCAEWIKYCRENGR